MKNNPTWMPVVAALIHQADGCFLLHKRPAGKPHAGQWEFPGGKVEATENPREALCRELEEELGIRVSPALLTPAAFADLLPDNRVVLILYRIDTWEGDPEPLEGDAIGWFTSDAARGLSMPPLDQSLLAAIYPVVSPGVG